MISSAPPLDLEYLARIDWWRNVAIGDIAGCWPWIKSTGSHGYGQTWDRIAVRVAHRVAWALHHGEQVPDGLTIDHACRNKVCCNPAHLRLMTNVENARQNGQWAKTHCPRGHPYDAENTYITRRGHRQCRACRRAPKAEV